MTGELSGAMNGELSSAMGGELSSAMGGEVNSAGGWWESAVALHGTRAGRSAGVRADGLSRPDSACFVLPVDASAEVRRRTLTLVLYFGLSLTTLRSWVAEPPSSYADWYRRHSDRLPAVAMLRPSPAWYDLPATAWRRYDCHLTSAYGPSARYVKVVDGGPCPPGLVLDVIPVTVDDVAAAEARLDREPAAGPYDDAPFYRKVVGAGPASGPGPANGAAPDDAAAHRQPTRGGCAAVRIVPDGTRHPDEVLAAPLLCAELASLLAARIDVAAGIRVPR